MSWPLEARSRNFSELGRYRADKQATTKRGLSSHAWNRVFWEYLYYKESPAWFTIGPYHHLPDPNARATTLTKVRVMESNHQE